MGTFVLRLVLLACLLTFASIKGGDHHIDQTVGTLVQIRNLAGANLQLASRYPLNF
jgi:hypothetical protein